MKSWHAPTLFTRNNRPLHTLWLESKAWFCAHELGRMMGRHLDERQIRRLDQDQQRRVLLLRYGHDAETLMVSESGAYALLAQQYVPENRHLRHWLTHEVVAVLRDGLEASADAEPRWGQMRWGEARVVDEPGLVVQAGKRRWRGWVGRVLRF